jgi:hypothetical protein
MPTSPRFIVEVHLSILVHSRESLASVHLSNVPVKSRQLAGARVGQHCVVLSECVGHILEQTNQKYCAKIALLFVLHDSTLQAVPFLHKVVARQLSPTLCSGSIGGVWFETNISCMDFKNMLKNHTKLKPMVCNLKLNIMSYQKQICLKTCLQIQKHVGAMTQARPIHQTECNVNQMAD